MTSCYTWASVPAETSWFTISFSSSARPWHLELISNSFSFSFWTHKHTLRICSYHWSLLPTENNSKPLFSASLLHSRLFLPPNPPPPLIEELRRSHEGLRCQFSHAMETKVEEGNRRPVESRAATSNFSWEHCSSISESLIPHPPSEPRSLSVASVFPTVHPACRAWPSAAASVRVGTSRKHLPQSAHFVSYLQKIYLFIYFWIVDPNQDSLAVQKQSAANQLPSQSDAGHLQNEHFIKFSHHKAELSDIAQLR